MVHTLSNTVLVSLLIHCNGLSGVFHSLSTLVAIRYTLSTLSCICRITFIMEIYYRYTSVCYSFYTHIRGGIRAPIIINPERGGYACAYIHTLYKIPDLPLCQVKKNGGG